MWWLFPKAVQKRGVEDLTGEVDAGGARDVGASRRHIQVVFSVQVTQVFLEAPLETSTGNAGLL